MFMGTVLPKSLNDWHKKFTKFMKEKMIKEGDLKEEDMDNKETEKLELVA